jgi:hypothetical protein
LIFVIDARERRFVSAVLPGNGGSFARVDQRIHHDGVGIDIGQRAEHRPTGAAGSTGTSRAAGAACSTGTAGTAGTKAYELQRLKAPPVTATPEAVTGALSSRASTGCAGPAAPDSVTLPATLDGVPVALVFRPPTSSEQRVEAWSCDGSSLLASATVPR